MTVTQWDLIHVYLPEAFRVFGLITVVTAFVWLGMRTVSEDVVQIIRCKMGWHDCVLMEFYGHRWIECFRCGGRSDS